MVKFFWNKTKSVCVRVCEGSCPRLVPANLLHGIVISLTVSPSLPLWVCRTAPSSQAVLISDTQKVARYQREAI